MKTAAIIVSLASVALSYKPLCGQFSAFEHSKYNFNNNAYNMDTSNGNQCLYIDSAKKSGVAWHTTWTWTENSDDSPISYPYSGIHVKTGQLIDSFTTMPTEATWDYDTSDIVADVSYDIFTASDPNHDPSSGDFELMIWLGQYGGKTPLGSQMEASKKIGGIDWSVWVGSQPINGVTQTTYTFLAPSDRTHFKGDIQPFFQHLINKYQFPASSQYLLTVQFGTEPFSGGPATLNVHNWVASLH